MLERKRAACDRGICISMGIEEYQYVHKEDADGTCVDMDKMDGRGKEIPGSHPICACSLHCRAGYKIANVLESWSLGILPSLRIFKHGSIGRFVAQPHKLGR
jgi:hypothetical protein